MKRSAFPTLVVAAVLLSACSDEKSPTGPDATETYSASVSGDITASLNGPAAFGSDPNGGEPVFAILLGSPTTDHVLVLARAGTARPGVGSYEIIDPFFDNSPDGWTALHLVADGDELIASFIGVTGEIRITQSSSRQLKGTFEFDANGFFEADPNQERSSVSVSGSFDAGQSSNITAGFRSALRWQLH